MQAFAARKGVAAKNDASYDLSRARASVTGQTTIAASTATTSLPNGRIVTRGCPAPTPWRSVKSCPTSPSNPSAAVGTPSFSLAQSWSGMSPALRARIVPGDGSVDPGNSRDSRENVLGTGLRGRSCVRCTVLFCCREACPSHAVGRTVALPLAWRKSATSQALKWYWIDGVQHCLRQTGASPTPWVTGIGGTDILSSCLYTPCSGRAGWPVLRSGLIADGAQWNVG